MVKALVLFTVLFVANRLLGFFQAEQIFLNVLLLNLLLIYFLALVRNGRFAIRQPPDLLIRKVQDIGVYLWQDGVIRHIPDPPTLALLGYSFDDVVDVSSVEFKSYVQRPAIESVNKARLVQLQSRPGEVWMLIGDARRRVPDEFTLAFIQQLNQRPVETISESEFNSRIEIPPLASILRLR